MRLTRLIERSDFLSAGSRGRRFRSPAFTAQVLDRDAIPALAGEPMSQLRIGLTASRRVGNAPERNRIRRRLRAASAEALAPHAGTPVDVVLVARREALSAPFAQLTSDIARSIAGARAVKITPQTRAARSTPVQPPQKR